MRLWHQSLLPYLSTKRLVRQHCECCALRGNGWGRKHATVDYVFKHDYYFLVAYHVAVMQEMTRRGYKYDDQWERGPYRGKHCEEYPTSCPKDIFPELLDKTYHHKIIYPEHDDAYLQFCLKHLEEKGEHIEWKQEQK